jgi:hypothetical protein
MKGQGSGSKGRGLRAVMAAEILMLGSAFLGAERLAAASKERPTIHVDIYNYAEFSNATLEEAEGVATRVLLIAGIETSWYQYRKGEADSNAKPDPSRFESGPRIYLLLVPRTMAARWALGKTCLGRSIIPGDGTKGVRAYVFYHRVEELAATEEASAAQILGHAMAHEIGHLLLNSNKHSDTGIMQALWRNEQMELLRSRLLLFTRAQ